MNSNSSMSLLEFGKGSAKLTRDESRFACKWWTENLHQNAWLGTTHDLGFMIAPWAKVAWELNRDQRAFETLRWSAKTLYGRFRQEVGLIRSWDTCVTKRYQFLDPQTEFLTVIVGDFRMHSTFT